MLRRDIFKLDASKAMGLEPGSPVLAIPSQFTRCGVFPYSALSPEGELVTRWELRHPSEVFAAESLATMRGVPLVEGHPEMVTPENYQSHVRGHVGDNVSADGTFVAGTLYVGDSAVQAAIKAKTYVELSMGYYADIVDEVGTYDGVPYDSVQRNIRYNHVGIGPEDWGRAGNDVRVFLDGGITHQEAAEMDKITKARMDHGQGANQPKADKDEAGPSITHSIDVLGLMREKAEAEAKLKKTEEEKLALEARVTALEGASKPSPEEVIAEGVKEVIGLQKDCKDLGVSFADTDSAADLRAKVLAKLAPSFKADSKSDLKGPYEVAIASYREAVKGTQRADSKTKETTAHVDGEGKKGQGSEAPGGRRLAAAYAKQDARFTGRKVV
jgi:hypothetical protein